MRRAALLLSLLTLLSLAFAPAPLRRERETPAQKAEREVNALARRLKELEAEWHVANGQGGAVVRYAVAVTSGTRQRDVHQHARQQLGRIRQG